MRCAYSQIGRAPEDLREGHSGEFRKNSARRHRLSGAGHGSSRVSFTLAHSKQEHAMISLLLLTALAAAADAAPAREVPEVQLVSHADLDLSSTNGRVRLEQRVRSAADRLCRDDLRASPEGGYLNRKCFDAAVANALPQVRLAVARARNGEAPVAIALSRR
jgi:UrcA family protein